MEKQKYRLEFWRNGKKMVSKISNELPQAGSQLTKDLYITRKNDWRYTVKEVTLVDNSTQTTYVLNQVKNNPEVPADLSYVVMLK